MTEDRQQILSSVIRPHSSVLWHREQTPISRLSRPHGEEPRSRRLSEFRELSCAASRTMTGHPADIVGGAPGPPRPSRRAPPNTPIPGKFVLPRSSGRGGPSASACLPRQFKRDVPLTSQT